MTSVIMGKMMSKIGKLFAIRMLSVMLCLSMGIFGLAMMLQNRFWIVGLCLVARVLQGSAVGGISAVVYSYVPLLFSDNTYAAISYLELSIGLGMTAGTVIGNLLS